MPPDVKDMARMWDMLDAARAITGFVKGKALEDLLSDRQLRNAVERNLEIIGEAARNVSAVARDENPNIPWTSIIGLRNVIAHEYGDIKYEKIWGICTNRLPVLIQQLEETGVENPPTQG